MEKYKNAAKGLNTMFVAEIGVIVCSVIAVIPLIGVIGGIGNLVFAILILLGLNNAGKDIEGCQKAFKLSIINIVLSVLALVFAKVAVLSFLIGIASSVVSFLVIYNVCVSVAAAVREAGAGDVADSGEKVYKINFWCYALSIVASILGVIPVLGAVIAGVIGVVVGIASLVAGIMYLIFLNKSSKVLA